jgi:hypothetical protein
VAAGEKHIAALPVPIAAIFRSADTRAGYPELGEANAFLDNNKGN